MSRRRVKIKPKFYLILTFIIGVAVAVLAIALQDSAGGTLAAVCALQARDAGLPLALLALVYTGKRKRSKLVSRGPIRKKHTVLTSERNIT